jgi:hypothetical protein
MECTDCGHPGGTRKREDDPVLCTDCWRDRKAVKHLMDSNKIKSLYDTYIIKDIPYEDWVRNTYKRIRGKESY